MADLDLVRRLLTAEHGLVVIATTRADGSVQASVLNGGVMANPLGDGEVFACVTPGGTVKLGHLRRRPRATVVARSGWQWAALEGPATLVGPDDPVDGLAPEGVPGLLRDVFVGAGGTHDDWDEFDRVMAAERRTAILVSPERVYSNRGT